MNHVNEENSELKVWQSVYAVMFDDNENVETLLFFANSIEHANLVAQKHYPHRNIAMAYLNTTIEVPEKDLKEYWSDISEV